MTPSGRTHSTRRTSPAAPPVTFTYSQAVASVVRNDSVRAPGLQKSSDGLFDMNAEPRVAADAVMERSAEKRIRAAARNIRRLRSDCNARDHSIQDKETLSSVYV